MIKRNKFIVAVAIPLLILLAISVKPAVTLLYGKEILLETRAVDPNDLFRGDYVAVAFKISDIPKAMLPEWIKAYSGNSMKSTELYVYLQKQGEFYEIAKVSDKPSNEGIYLKGQLRYYNYSQMPDTVHLEFTLDKYFVPQGSGLALQEKSSRGELVGRVKVLGGYGILVGVEPLQQ